MSMVPAELGAALVEAARHPLALLTSHAAPLQSVITSFALGREVSEANLMAAVGGADTMHSRAGIVERIQGRAGQDIAVLHLHGIALYNFEFPGLAYSTRMLALTMKQLAADNTIGGILLNVNSPGGSVVGVEEAADAIASYRQYRTRPKDISGLAKNLRKGEDGRYHWHWDPAFIRGDKSVNHSSINQPELMLAAARKLEVPVLLVRGRESDVVSEAGANEFTEAVPHAKFADVSGAGHMVAGDRNDAFSEAVIDFLRESY